MSSAICSGSAEQPANNSKDSSAEHMCSAVQPGKPPPKGKRQGITNRTLTKEEYRRSVTRETTLQEKAWEVYNTEPKKTCRLKIYKYRNNRVGTADPTRSQFPSECQRPSICDMLIDSMIPPLTQGACRWCGKFFSSSTTSGIESSVAQHLGNNKKCFKNRKGVTTTPQEAILPNTPDSIRAREDIIRLNRAKYRAREFLIGNEFEPEFLDAWDRKLKEAHSVDSTENVLNQLVEIIRQLREWGYLPESEGPPGMRPPGVTLTSAIWRFREKTA